MVFQAALFDSLTVEENVGFSLYQQPAAIAFKQLATIQAGDGGVIELANATQPSCRWNA